MGASAVMGFRHSVRALSIQSLIGKIGKIHDAFRNTIRPSSVFMDSSANVQRGRGEGAMSPIGIPLDNRIPSTLTGTAFDPEHLIPVSRAICPSLIDSETIRSEVRGEFHDP